MPIRNVYSSHVEVPLDANGNPATRFGVSANHRVNIPAGTGVYYEPVVKNGRLLARRVEGPEPVYTLQGVGQARALDPHNPYLAAAPAPQPGPWLAAAPAPAPAPTPNPFQGLRLGAPHVWHEGAPAPVPIQALPRPAQQAWGVIHIPRAPQVPAPAPVAVPVANGLRPEDFAREDMLARQALFGNAHDFYAEAAINNIRQGQAARRHYMGPH